MPNIDSKKTVGQLVAERPSRSRVFEDLGIDFCCGGKVPLSEASKNKGLPLESVLDALMVSDENSDTMSTENAAAMLMTDLCDHIEQTHHQHLKKELPRLRAMVQKVASVHGENHPWLREIESVFCPMTDELEAHMAKEEQILFPLIRSIDHVTGEHRPANMSVALPIRVMEHEHDDAGAALQRMRELSHDYKPPKDACNTFIAMLDGLRELELDMHQHVHKENNVLFPRAEKAELGAAT